MKSTYTSEGNFLGFKFGKSIDIPKILAIPFWILYGIGYALYYVGKAVFKALTNKLAKHW